MFGGCAEFCFDSTFKITKEGHAGEFVTIQKKKPSSFVGVMTEMFTDSDVYELTFTDPSIDSHQKAALMSSAFLLDYIFFERDGDKCGTERDPQTGRNVCFITICNMYCFGMICPCRCKLGGGNQDGGS